MFLGVNTLNLDAKGRMAIPAKHREALADCCASRIVVTINPTEKCLWMYPENEWHEIAAKLSRLPTLNRQNQTLQRMLLGHASELEMDGQGRILLSTELREYAQMTKKIWVVGEGHKFEIWSDELWQANLPGWMDEAASLEDELPADLSQMVF